MIRGYDSVSGKVNFDGKILYGVRWQHNKESYTGGYFSFPYDRESTFKLSPIKQGYAFTPENIYIDEAVSANAEIEFIVSSLQITDGLTALYKLDGSIKNLVNSNQKHLEAESFVNDSKRGVVLKLENGAYTPLKQVNEYGIVNSSFTISVYFKLIQSKADGRDCIFGSDEQGFRKGLHAIIVSGSPRFGFYTDDCSASMHIEPVKWYQLTVRYDINSETQSIFINGEKVGESQNRPSFIGNAELLLGHGIKFDNYLNGYLDDFYIWNRALSDDEIAWQSKNSVIVPGKNWIITHLNVLLLILAVLFGTFVFVYPRRKRIIKKTGKVVDKTIGQSPRNTIHLYGKFMVTDNNGVDHASEFSPKTKELFILLLLHSIENPKGISSSKLTETIWCGFTSAKAANNRGVTFNLLRKILANINGVEVIYENKYWRVVLPEEMICDYKIVTGIIANKEDDDINLFAVIRRGEFLTGATKEWMLDYRSTHNFDLIDHLLLYLKEQFSNKDYDTTIEVATYILNIDDLNLQALYYQLRCLNKQGSGNKATFLFDKFSKRYQVVHSKSFERTMSQFLEMDVDSLC